MVHNERAVKKLLVNTEQRGEIKFCRLLCKVTAVFTASLLKFSHLNRNEEQDEDRTAREKKTIQFPSHDFSPRLASLFVFGQFTASPSNQT
jgi:hypothetical protein